MIFSISKQTRVVIVIMTALVLTGILIAHFYYKNINDASDPRVLKAKLLYKKYSQYIEENNYKKVFESLDSILNCLGNISHYKNSYETGVVYNDKAAALLTLSLYKNKIAQTNLSEFEYAEFTKDSLLVISEMFLKKSVEIYESWILEFKGLNRRQIKTKIKNDFPEDDPALINKNIDELIDKRAKEIELAQKETSRRISVSYTNLGIIERQKGNIEEAIKYYKKAIELWEKNLTAKNNLNVLFGRPVEKRSFFEKLFPPEKEN